MNLLNIIKFAFKCYLINILVMLDKVSKKFNSAVIISIESFCKLFEILSKLSV